VWQGLLDGADAIAVDLGGDGTLEQIEGDDDAKGAFFGADDETLDAGEGAAVDADALAGTEVRPRHEEGLSGDEGSEIVNLTDRMGAGVLPMPTIWRTPGTASTRTRSARGKRPKR